MKPNIYVVSLFTISILVLLLLTIYYTNTQQPPVSLSENFISISEVADNVFPRVATHISKKASDWVAEKKDGFEGSVGKLKEDWRYLNDAETFDDLEKRWETTKAEYVDSLERMGLTTGTANATKEHFLTPQQISNQETIYQIMRELPSYTSQSNDIAESRKKAKLVLTASKPSDTTNFNSAATRMVFNPVTKKYVIGEGCAENTCEGQSVPIQYSPTDNAFVMETKCDATTMEIESRCKSGITTIDDKSVQTGNQWDICNNLMDLKRQYESQLNTITKFRDFWLDMKRNEYNLLFETVSNSVTTKTGTSEEQRKKDIEDKIDAVEKSLNSIIEEWKVDKIVIDNAVANLRPDVSGLRLIVRPPPAKVASVAQGGIASTGTVQAQTSGRGGRITRGRTVSQPAPSQLVAQQPTTQSATQSASRSRTAKGRGSRQLFTDYVQKIEGFFGFNQRNMEEYTTIDRVKQNESSAYLLLDIGNFIPPYLRVNTQVPMMVKTWSS